MNVERGTNTRGFSSSILARVFSALDAAMISFRASSYGLRDLGSELIWLGGGAGTKHIPPMPTAGAQAAPEQTMVPQSLECDVWGFERDRSRRLDGCRGRRLSVKLR